MSNLVKYAPVYHLEDPDRAFEYVPFYRELSDRGKRKFQHRVRKFIRTKDFEFFFEGEKDQQAIKILIASSFIQLTWGLDDHHLSSYSYIGVHPNGIRLKKERGKSMNALWIQSKANHSWNDGQDDFFLSTQGRQPGLMEWTNVFIIEAKKDNIMDDFFSAYYKVWCEAARDIMFVVDEEDHLPLDTFGKKLPVIIQHFFEEPEALQQNHPEIYEHTKILLNLDLLEAREFDFVHSEKIKKEKNLRVTNRALIFGVQDKVRKFGLPAGIMYTILMQMPVIILIWFHAGRWMYSSWTFWLAFVGFSFAGTFLVRKFYYLKRGLAMHASIALFIIGLLPFVYGAMTFLNYMIPIEHHTRTCRITKVSDLEGYLPWVGFTKPHFSRVMIMKKKSNLAENPIEDKRDGDYIVLSEYKKQYEINNAVSLFDKDDVVEIHTHIGLFGAEVFDGYELTIYN